MIRLLILFFVILSGCQNHKNTGHIYQAQVFRDEFGVPHVYGQTDADVVFAATYARAEDEFDYMEQAYIKLSGQVSAIKGKDYLPWDIFVRKLQLVEYSQQEYLSASEDVKQLCDAFAAGMNHYLLKNPQIKPRLITKFEPWHALLGYRIFHLSGIGDRSLKLIEQEGILEGFSAYLASTMWVIAPEKSTTGHAMLMINPHIPMDAPYEMHLQSKQGLHVSGQLAYGIGILPISGHNEQIGWSITANEPHINDVYHEKFLPDDTQRYIHGVEVKPVIKWQQSIWVKKAEELYEHKFQFAKTDHGPLFDNSQGEKLALKVAKIKQGGVLQQFYAMSRANNLQQFKNAIAPMNLTYNNIAYAGRDGHIFYVYGGAIPKRQLNHNWKQPLDGSDPSYDWQGFLSLDELPQLQNPESGYIQNSNSSPFVSSTLDNPSSLDFSSDLFRNGQESDTAIAQRSRQILEKRDHISFEDLAHMAFDAYMPKAKSHINALVTEWDKTKENEHTEKLLAAIQLLQQWDYRSDVDSVAAALYYGMYMNANYKPPYQWLNALKTTISMYQQVYGDWRIPIGRMIRLQRPLHQSTSVYDDAQPSLPVAGMPFHTGTIFTVNTVSPQQSLHNYAQHGHSYVAIIEFADVVKAKSIMAFGQSRDHHSPHYFDQAQLYAQGQFKQAWFDKQDVVLHAKQHYRLDYNERKSHKKSNSTNVIFQ